MSDRAELEAGSGDHSMAWATASGQLLRPLPRTYLAPEQLDDWTSRCRAAVRYAGDDAAVSHLWALRCWDLPVPDTDAVQVLVPHEQRPRAGESSAVFPVDVRRSRHPADTRLRGGVRVVTLERAVVESWPLLEAAAQRAPAIVAVRRRLTTPGRLRHQLRAHPRLKGRRSLHELLDLLEDGCHSELEIWGHRKVFTGSPFAQMKRQVRRVVAGRVVYLDIFDSQTLLALELDGREYHDHPRQRERDIARDAALAEEGVLTLRFSHSRLTGDPPGCRRQSLRVMSVRRQQLGLPPLGTPVTVEWPDPPC